ncbi:MFS transporter [Kitasatospora paranensis]|uniref:MFS transporter n=1 Tax=Kitasatospora paranensis TaxID=258053 RepID=A0ABW2FLS6_9ACTN
MRIRLSQRRVVPIMTVSTTFISIVDGAITTVALPSIARQFHMDPAALTAVVVAYPACLGLMIPASAWLLDRFGVRAVLLAALGAFTAASALCGAAPGPDALIAARAVQGLAAGLLMPASQTLLFRTFSHTEQVRLSRLLVIPQQIAPALAPILGGVLATSLSWRWVFYVNVPFGLAAALFGLLFLTGTGDRTAGRLDLPGLLASAGAIGALMYGACAGPDLGWTRPQVLTALVGGAVLLATAVRWELRTAEPALRLGLFRDRLMRDTNVIALLGYVPIMGAMFLTPLFIQDVRGGSALDSGTSTFTEAFGVLLTMQVVSAVYGRIGPRLIIAGGLAGVTGVLLLLATSDAHTGLWTFRLQMFLLGLAMGAFFMPTTIASFTTIDRADISQAAMLNTIVRQSANALAPATVATALVLGSPSGDPHHPPLAAYQHTYLVLAAVAAAAVLFTLTMPRGRVMADTATEPRPATRPTSRAGGRSTGGGQDAATAQ